MSKTNISVNTSETFGVTSRYILQHNAISRSAHNLSATARKLTALAMSLLPADLSSLTASFTFSDFCKALGYGDGGEQYKLFKAAVKECVGSVISVETESDNEGNRDWKMFTWFTVAKFSEKTGKVTMTFSSELAVFLAALKWVYTKIDLRTVGSLQSRYAIHLYELLISYAFLKGKNGNKTNAWYVQFDIPDLRFIMGTPETAYQETHLFKQNVIEKPVKEINRAGMGLEIAIISIKQGRCLVGIRFDCRQVPKQVPIISKRKKNAENQLALPDPNLKLENRREEQELQHLKDLYPTEFVRLYENALMELPVFGGNIGESFRKGAAERSALERLREQYGIVK